MRRFIFFLIAILPLAAEVAEGHQVFHRQRRDRHYTRLEEWKQFVETYFGEAKRCLSDAETLRVASDSVILDDGAYIEAGVCSGKTINFIAALNPEKTIYGFDSFEGLPTEWAFGKNYYPQGAFTTNGELPNVLLNVELFKGWFSDTLSAFKREILHNQPVALLHVDCDLYSSTKEVLTCLQDNIVAGTIIAFDEFYNLEGIKDHEFKALYEFLEETGYGVEYVAFNVNGLQVAVKITQPK